MNNNRNVASHDEHVRAHFCSMHCVSWSAIVIGSIVAIGLSFLLNLLALAIGLTAFPTDPTGQTVFAAGGFVGLVIIAIITMFPAGFIAGCLGRNHCISRRSGELYGFTAWGLALIITMILASHVGAFMTQANYVMNRNVMEMSVTNSVNNVDYQPSKKPTNTPALKMSPEAASTAAGVASLGTFFIFFIGMLAACFGGRIGMCRHRKCVDPMHCPQCKK